MTLGRDPDCEIVLDHVFFSRRHAAFDVDGAGRVVIRDLGSTQGTYVNGSRIDAGPLDHGDVVGFGPEGIFKFRFEVAAVRQASSDPPSHPSVVTIGRAPDNDVVLDSPGVSRYHARIGYTTGEPLLADAGSLNGTFVNGEPVREARRLVPTDLVFLGGVLLRVNGREISRRDLGSSHLIASGLTKAYGEKTVLHDVSFGILPREFVGFMGPSGCGKSTLMDALNGLRPATRGAVFIDELDLYRNFDAVRRSMGYVPQRDILHDALTVERTLHYVALLRLPEHTSRADARETIDEVIQAVGLAEHRETTFGQLSGGQRKRLSLAMELLTKPSFLFLDEPTSPLDPVTSENLMVLFRQLADEGRILVMVTHKFEKLELMHQILLLTPDGHLAYFGPPADALRYFDCKEPSGLYRRVGARDSSEVSRAFKASEDFRKHVAARVDTESMDGAAANLGTATAEGARSSGLRQWRILTQRYLEIKLKDRRNTLLLVGQAPVIAFILSLMAGGVVSDAKTLFIGAIIAVWFGGNNAIREIVAEQPIYRRERLVNLKIPSYLGSKFAVLGGITVAQCLLFVGTLVGFGSLQSEDSVAVATTLCLTAFGGVGLGLLGSAVVNSPEKAMSVLPAILIPQLLLSGFMKPLDDFYLNTVTLTPATEEQYLDYERLATPEESGGAMPQTVSPGAAGEPVTLVEGLGNLRFASALILARWSVDALVHCVSVTSTETRDRLAGRFYVAAYDRVWDGGPVAAIEEAFWRRTYLNWFALVVTTAACLALAGVALKSKDSL